MIAKLFRRYQSDAIILAALGLASALCVALLAARVWAAGNFLHVWLIWNLFLAWLPLLFAYAARALYAGRTWLRYPAFAACAGLWLLFFPNAPYILTDLMHLRFATDFPLWYDVTLIMAFAWTGLLLGFLSLYLMQTLVARSLGPVAGWLFALGALGLSAFGVYVGRFLRWNSWDAFTAPQALLTELWTQLRHPLAHPRTYGVTLMLAAFFITAYFVLFAFTRLRAEGQRN